MPKKTTRSEISGINMVKLFDKKDIVNTLHINVAKLTTPCFI